MHFEFIHFYVENARYWRDWFIQALGFQPLNPCLNPMPESWTSDSPLASATQTFGVKSGEIQIFLSSACHCSSPVFSYLNMHPPGVADLAFRVTELEAAVTRAAACGARILHPPQVRRGDGREIKTATIAGWGNLRHTLVEYLSRRPTQPTPSNVDARAKAAPEAQLAASLGKLTDDRAIVHGELPDTAPQPQPLQHESEIRRDRPSRRSCSSSYALAPPQRNAPSMFSAIDHAVINVPQGHLQEAVAWYKAVFGFEPQQSFQIQTQRSALRSQVLSHPAGPVQVPINEPASSASQIQEFLDCNGGIGIQHIALSTTDIIHTIAHLRQRGVGFLAVPPAYYDQLQERPAFRSTTVNWRAIADQQILVDWADDHPQAMLLQTFTQPLFGQPTFFFEIIQRQTFRSNQGYQIAEGFGEGNFQALFEAIEREQIKRGSLS